jgi:AcrR family transcriptional regulator
MRGDDRTTKEKLLAEARDHFLEVGPEAFSLREVARRVGLTAAAVYRHFDGKEALLAAVCDEGFRVFASYLMGALAKPSPLERLRTSGKQYLRFALDRPRDYRVIFMSEAPKEKRAGRGGGSSPSPSFQFLVDRVRECMDAGDLAAGDPEEAAVTIWAHVHGMVSLWLSGHLAPVGDAKAFAALFERSTDKLLAGLAR